MEEMTPADRQALINALASREGTARQIASWYGTTVAVLKRFVKENHEELERTRAEFDAAETDDDKSDVVTPADLDGLWISKKLERLTRLQNIADKLYEEVIANPTDSTTLREFRSYTAAVANELGQLLHRGAGESGSDSLSVDIPGVDLESMR